MAKRHAWRERGSDIRLGPGGLPPCVLAMEAIEALCEKAEGLLVAALDQLGGVHPPEAWHALTATVQTATGQLQAAKAPGEAPAPKT